jgi:hypothetical protein
MTLTKNVNGPQTHQRFVPDGIETTKQKQKTQITTNQSNPK